MNNIYTLEITQEALEDLMNFVNDGKADNFDKFLAELETDEKGRIARFVISAVSKRVEDKGLYPLMVFDLDCKYD